MTDNNDNLHHLPTPLDQIAKDIRADFARREGGRAEWIEGTLALAADMLKGRKRFPNNYKFSMWLVENELNLLNKDDQGALLEMAEEPDYFRLVLEETERMSLQHIRNNEFRRPLHVQRTPDPAIIDTSEPGTEQDESSEAELERKVSRIHGEPQRGTRPGRHLRSRPGHKNSASRLPAMGEAGQYLDTWIRKGVPPGRLAPIFAVFWLGNLPRTVIKKIAAFVAANPDLPPPFCGSKDPSPRLFWKEMPEQIINKIERSVPLKQAKDGEEGHPDYARVMLATLEAWPHLIGPVHAAWIAAGKPIDSRQWYVRYISKRPIPVAVLAAVPHVPPTADFIASLPPAMAELLNPDRPYENHHKGFQPSAEGPIRAYGAQIWPRPPNARWSFHEAFYAFHLWNELQPLMKETRPVERARALMNPFRVIIANLSGGVAEALNEILIAQFQHPEREAETTAPPKRLNFEF